MKNRSYYSFSDMTVNAYKKCSVESASAPIVVNCAGQMQMTYPFTTDNKEGRLDYYLMYIKSGRIRLSSPQGELIASAGDAVCFPPRRRYTYSFSDEGELNYFWCHFTGSDAASLVSELGFGELPNVRHVGHEALINAEFERIFSLFSECDDLRERVIGHAFEGLLLNIAKIVRNRIRKRKLYEGYPDTEACKDGKSQQFALFRAVCEANGHVAYSLYHPLANAKCLRAAPLDRSLRQRNRRDRWVRRSAFFQQAF